MKSLCCFRIAPSSHLDGVVHLQMMDQLNPHCEETFQVSFGQGLRLRECVLDHAYCSAEIGMEGEHALVEVGVGVATTARHGDEGAMRRGERRGRWTEM